MPFLNLPKRRQNPDGSAPILELKIDRLGEILQILSITLFEKVSMNQGEALCKTQSPARLILVSRVLTHP